LLETAEELLRVGNDGVNEESRRPAMGVVDGGR